MSKSDPADRPASLPSRTAPRPAPVRADPTDAPAPTAATAAPKTAPAAAAKTAPKAAGKAPAKAAGKAPAKRGTRTPAPAGETANAAPSAPVDAAPAAPVDVATATASEGERPSLFAPRQRRRPEPTMQLVTRVSLGARDLLDDYLDARGARRGDLRKVLEAAIDGYWTDARLSDDGKRSEASALATIDTLDDDPAVSVQLASRVAVPVRQRIDAAVSRTGLSLRHAVEAALVGHIGVEDDQD
jgi:hypothetical protein